MNRRSLLNLAMLTLAILLILVVIFEPGKQSPKELPNLTDLSKKEIHRIRIDRHDAETIVLERVADRWRMTQPVMAHVSPLRIDAILKLAETKSLGSYPRADRPLDTFGLEKPRVHVTFNDGHSIAFGNNTPLDNRRYLLFEDQIHLISDNVYYHLIGHFTTFIDTAPLPPQSRLEELHLPGFILRRVDNRWNSEPEPENYSADQAAALVEAWRHARAREVKEYRGEKGEEITLQLAGREQPLRFLVTARHPELVLARPELAIQYHLAEHFAAELLQLNPVEK